MERPLIFLPKLGVAFDVYAIDGKLPLDKAARPERLSRLQSLERYRQRLRQNS